MMKRLMFVFIITMFLLALILPGAALAGGHEMPDSSGKGEDGKPGVHKMPEIPEDIEELILDDYSSQAMSTLSPTKHSINLDYDDEDGNYIYNMLMYEPTVTGFYTFTDTASDRDTDIYLYDSDSYELDNDSFSNPFAAWFYMEEGETYFIKIENWGDDLGDMDDTITYVVTTPKSIGSSALTLSSGGLSKYWMQAFDFTVPEDCSYSIHITRPSGSAYYYEVQEGDEYIPDDEGDDIGFEQVYPEAGCYAYVYGEELLTSEDYSAYKLLPGHSYHIVVAMAARYTSDKFTIAVDKATSGMVNGEIYNHSLDVYDNFTTQYFIPDSSGKYRISCSRTDAKVTVVTREYFDEDEDDYEEIYLLENASMSASKTITLEGGDDAPTYYFYFTTPASSSAGSISYSATYLSPDATLSNITATAGTLSPGFASDVYNYTLSVNSEESDSVTITPTVHAPGATTKINGTARSSITLPVTGTTSTPVAIEVTAPDGTSKKTYNVQVRAMSSACELLTVPSPLALHGPVAFATVDAVTTSLNLSGATVSANATWQLIYFDHETIVSDNTMSLTDGLNTHYIRVTSENGAHTKDYVVYVYRNSDMTGPAIYAYDPEGNELESGEIVNTDVQVVALGTTPAGRTIMFNGSAVGWTNPFTTEGSYTAIITDTNDNQAQISFTIDKTVPSIAAANSSGAVPNNAISATPVTVTVTDANPGIKAAKRGGADYEWPVGDTFSEDGVYSITTTDAAGNSSTFTFTVDGTKPAITAVCGTELADGGYAKGDVTVTVTDANFQSKSATRNGVALAWPSANKFTSEGEYRVTASDRASNVSVFTFHIDKTKPVITAKTTTKAAVSNNGKTKYDVVVTVTGATSKNMEYNSVAMAEWPADNTFRAEGNYVAKAYDLANNETVFAFRIDKAPVITAVKQTSLTTLANNDCTTEAVKVEYSEQFVSTKTLKKDSATLTWPSEGVTVSEDGKYYAYIKDLYGNYTSLTFYVDNASPKIEVKTKAKKILPDEGFTNESYLYVNVSDLTLKTKSVTKNGAAYKWPSGNKFSSEGVYVVTAVDKTGHTSVLHFTIDRSKPVITCKTAVSNKTLTSGSMAKEDVIISVTDRVGVSSELSFNSSPAIWPSDDTVSAEGVYTVSSKDALGYTSTFTFTIDKTLPAITAKSGDTPLENDAIVKTDVVVTYTELNYYSKSVTKDDRSYSWPRYNKFTSTGKYIVTVKDKAGNAATFTFTIDKAKPVISVKTTTKATVPNNGKSKYDVIATVTDLTALVKHATLDGSDYEWPTDGKIKQEGDYVLTATDAAGNTSSFSFRIDKPPVITVTPAVGDALSNNGYTAQNATISYTEKYFTSKTLKINGAVITWPADNTVNAEGVYTVTVKDLYGNYTTFTFTIDKTAPVITAKAASGAAVSNGGTTAESSVTVTVTEKNLASKTVTKNGGAMSWPLGSKFTAEGVYVITVTDKAGTVTSFTFTIDR